MRDSSSGGKVGHGATRVNGFIFVKRLYFAHTAHSGGGLVAKSCPTLATPWIVACQAPLSMGILQA